MAVTTEDLSQTHNGKLPPIATLAPQYAKLATICTDRIEKLKTSLRNFPIIHNIVANIYVIINLIIQRERSIPKDKVLTPEDLAIELQTSKDAICIILYFLTEYLLNYKKFLFQSPKCKLKQHRSKQHISTQAITEELEFLTANLKMLQANEELKQYALLMLKYANFNDKHAILNFNLPSIQEELLKKSSPIIALNYPNKFQELKNKILFIIDHEITKDWSITSEECLQILAAFQLPYDKITTTAITPQGEILQSQFSIFNIQYNSAISASQNILIISCSFSEIENKLFNDQMLFTIMQEHLLELTKFLESLTTLHKIFQQAKLTSEQAERFQTILTEYNLQTQKLQEEQEKIAQLEQELEQQRQQLRHQREIQQQTQLKLIQANEQYLATQETSIQKQRELVRQQQQYLASQRATTLQQLEITRQQEQQNKLAIEQASAAFKSTQAWKEHVAQTRAQKSRQKDVLRALQQQERLKTLAQAKLATAATLSQQKIQAFGLFDKLNATVLNYLAIILDLQAGNIKYSELKSIFGPNPQQIPGEITSTRTGGSHRQLTVNFHKQVRCTIVKPHGSKHEPKILPPETLKNIRELLQEIGIYSQFLTKWQTTCHIAPAEPSLAPKI